MRLSDSRSSWTRSLIIVCASIINVRLYLFEALRSRLADQQQAVVKNSTLYIDGGKQSFINVNSNGTQEGDVTVGISMRILILLNAGYSPRLDEYLIIVDLSKPWDWKTNVSIKALAKPGMPQLPTSPPVVSRGAFYYGSDNDPNIYLWGGTTSKANTSFPGFIGPLPITFTMWSFDTHSHEWDHYDMSDSVPYRPSSGAYAEARDQHRSFYLNGQIDSGSSTQTMSLSLDTKIFQEGMIVIDHSNQTAKNISTKGLVGDKPRTRGRMQYISGLGSHGIIVLIGGNEKNVTDTTDRSLGDLVSRILLTRYPAADVVFRYQWTRSMFSTSPQSTTTGSMLVDLGTASP